MAYFSKVQFNPRGMDDELRRAMQIGDTYFDHKLMWRLFIEQQAGSGSRRKTKARDFVFRRWYDPAGRVQYYIVSQRCPEPVEGLLLVQSKPYYPQPLSGQTIYFDLRANPSVSVPAEGKKNSLRHDVIVNARRRAKMQGIKDNTAIDQVGKRAAANWLLRRADKIGLTIMEEGLRADSYAQHQLELFDGRSIKFSSIDYSGAARVLDPHKLTYMLINGVGHAKGFGCGLLLIRPID